MFVYYNISAYEESVARFELEENILGDFSNGERLGKSSWNAGHIVNTRI